MKHKSVPLFLILTIATMLLILSAAIAAPILLRPFYYAHAALLHLPEQTGWSMAQIHEAYNEMLNFCLFGTPFGTGDLRWFRKRNGSFCRLRKTVSSGLCCSRCCCSDFAYFLAVLSPGPAPGAADGPRFSILDGKHPFCFLYCHCPAGRTEFRPGIRHFPSALLPRKRQLAVRSRHRPDHPDPATSVFPKLCNSGCSSFIDCLHCIGALRS